MMRLRCVAAVLMSVGLLVGGCNDEDGASSSSSSSSGQSTSGANAPLKAESGHATGRVLGEDGKPITVAEDITISLYGVSEAGEKVSYSPGVKPDGAYKQKLVPGAYRFGTSTLKAK